MAWCCWWKRPVNERRLIGRAAARPMRVAVARSGSAFILAARARWHGSGNIG